LAMFVVPLGLGIACFVAVGLLRSACRPSGVEAPPNAADTGVAPIGDESPSNESTASGSNVDSSLSDGYDTLSVTERIATTYASGRLGQALEQIKAVPDWHENAVLRKAFRDILLQWIRFDAIGGVRTPRRYNPYGWGGESPAGILQYEDVIVHLGCHGSSENTDVVSLVRAMAVPYAEELAASKDAADVEVALVAIEYLLLEQLAALDWAACTKLVGVFAHLGAVAGRGEGELVDRLLKLRWMLRWFSTVGFGYRAWPGWGWLPEGIYRQYPTNVKAQAEYRIELRRRLGSEEARRSLTVTTSERIIELAERVEDEKLKRQDASTALAIVILASKRQSDARVDEVLKLVKECVPQDAAASEAYVLFKRKPTVETRAALLAAMEANPDWPGCYNAR
jgi:hypothetical protein